MTLNESLKLFSIENKNWPAELRAALGKISQLNNVHFKYIYLLLIASDFTAMKSS